MKSSMHSGHTFSQVPKAEIQRSSFDRSHGYKTTFNSGVLVPLFVDEVLPGDTFNLSMTGFARMATPIFPLMDNLYLDSFFFFVPNRLIWSNWKKFCGEQNAPGDSTSFVIPQMVAPAGGYAVGTILDWMGLPTGIAGYSHSALPIRAYCLIYNEWFRDENLMTPYTIPLGDGPDVSTGFTSDRRGKRHDYFTSALPWPQKGSAVSIPLGIQAPVLGLYVGGTLGVTVAPGTAIGAASGGVSTHPATSQLYASSKSAIGTATATAFNTTNANVYADLSSATSATINQLRQSFQIQRLLERDARGGSRYTELVRSHFGVTSPDARLQRPEYLGGGSTPIVVSQVPKTGSTDATSPQGNLAAYATATAHGHGFTKSFTEHGYIIGIVNVRADMTYQQGLNRMWKRNTRYDFYWPALSHIGEQAITQDEIYCLGTGADATVFGYQERYAEYRYKPSQITGLFRSTAAGTLDAWHLAQKFTAAPTLNAAFIVENPPVSRVIAVPSQPEFIFDSYFKLTCARPMPVYGVPGMIDHF